MTNGVKLSTVADYDFATLYIPLLLLPDTVPDASLTEPVYIKCVTRLVGYTRVFLM
jgi:hypothetical protein